MIPAKRAGRYRMGRLWQATPSADPSRPLRHPARSTAGRNGQSRAESVRRDRVWCVAAAWREPWSPTIIGAAARRAGRGIVPRNAGRGIESSQRLGRHRWAVERTPAWPARFRRPAIRDERCQRRVVRPQHRNPEAAARPLPRGRVGFRCRAGAVYRIRLDPRQPGQVAEPHSRGEQLRQGDARPVWMGGRAGTPRRISRPDRRSLSAQRPERRRRVSRLD